MISPEHKEKMQAGRAAYQKSKREAKELALAIQKEKERDLTPEEKKLLALEESKIENSRERILKIIHKNKDDILKAQIDAAKGLHFSANDGNRIYQKAPNVTAGEYLLNQLIGKPTESLEIKQITKIQVDL